MECTRKPGGNRRQRAAMVGMALAALAGPAAGQQRGGFDVKGYWFMVTLPDSGREIRGAATMHVERRVIGWLRLDQPGKIDVTISAN